MTEFKCVRKISPLRCRSTLLVTLFREDYGKQCSLSRADVFCDPVDLCVCLSEGKPTKTHLAFYFLTHAPVLSVAVARS